MNSSNQPKLNELFEAADNFVDRHIGPRSGEIQQMLEVVGAPSLQALIDEAVPATIRSPRKLNLPAALTESEALESLKDIASRNKDFRSFIGMGYYGTRLPNVILRNILEEPGWYTQYTPYQAEISQGRLEALLNFQTLVSDLTGMEMANASMLDEATAAAEAMTMSRRLLKRGSTKNTFFVSNRCHPQTIGVVQTRADSLGIELLVGDHQAADIGEDIFGVLVQYPDTNGTIEDFQSLAEKVHEVDGFLTVATDLMALTLLRPPSQFGADIVVGNSQRFGVPMGFGGPHAAFMATSEKFQRQLPGRLIGVSVDSTGQPALRMALQTREQHIRRERATSNICTAQVLLAIMASMYAVYHGPDGLKRIARRISSQTAFLAEALKKAGYTLLGGSRFDTIKIISGPKSGDELHQAASTQEINLRLFNDGAIGISLDETVERDDIVKLLKIFGASASEQEMEELAASTAYELPDRFSRDVDMLTHPVFNSYHSETEMLRYIRRLQGRDLSLAHSMISLGSCTMKLNASAEMIPITWPEFANLHPFAPADQTAGYRELFATLEQWLAEITGFSATSLQPNAGSQGEYAGLLVIRAHHEARGEGHRDVCLIPSSAHGTNPASAVQAGMKVVVVACDDDGNIDLENLRQKAEKHSDQLAALMITYPSTHGVYESAVREICDVVHEHGGQVYLDGANLNALLGVARPGEFGADVCHLNLHKTFAIPHGGGGPGMGPICVADHLAPFLPGHPVVSGIGGKYGIGPVAAAPWGSPSILPISYAYILMMGARGLTYATEMAVLNANYIACRLDAHFPVLYKGESERVAHECIIDLRQLKANSGIKAEDVAKRLMDYGFHSPTMSFPVPGTLMIEPTESESLQELDRFCEAMIAIRAEIEEIEAGESDKDDNPLLGAPHTAEMISSSEWNHPYSREIAAYPLAWVRDRKFWPFVGRIDNVYGDRNLFCQCVPVDDYDTE